MDLISRIALHFEDNVSTTMGAVERLALPVAEAADSMVRSLLSNGKILACGNAGSAASAQHFVAQLVGHFERERPELAAIALTTDCATLSSIASSEAWEQVFAKQVRALGQPGDVLLALSTSGRSPSILAAVEAAHERDLRVVALTGRDGGQLATLLREGDTLICVEHERVARIQELHLLAIHCICDGIDCLLMGEE
ncbi:MAG: phosphoheptose isomerase [Candidatus Dactylopiibacterium sp.]|nr:phosphoheptose isomerase [Candidatus Dactylopiibacterium sp.]